MERIYPAVSVIIPIFKAENYLRECLDSVVNQTLKNIEIICVDDGSPDHSADIAAEYAQKYTNVKLLRKENGGQSSARNLALEHAEGKYVYFLDSDDYLELNMLEEVYSKAVKEDLDMVFFNAVPFYESKQDKLENSHYTNFYKRKGNYSGIYTGQTLFTMMHQNREFLGSPCFEIIRRSLIEDNNLLFYNGIIHEDNLFVFQCTMLAERATHIDKVFYHRRLHSDSTMTTQKSMKNVEGYLVSYSEMLHFMYDRPVEEAAFPFISDYLCTSILGCARNIFCSLDIPSDEAILTQGGFCASFFLDTLKRSSDTEFDRSSLKAENDSLRAALQAIEQQYESSFTFRVGRIVTLLPRMAARTIACLRENGPVVTLRKIIDTIVQKAKAVDERAQKFAVYKLLTYLPRKVIRSARWLRGRGISYACRCIWLKLRANSHSSAPLVSIILPVYNVEPFLEQCMDSLLNQTLKSIEIIAVDDGSTDRSLEILNQYAAKDNRVHVFTQQNQYAGAARNLGLSHAKGEYVIFLDSDDFFSPNLAKDAYVAAKAANADIVIFGGMCFNNATGEYSKASWFLQEKNVPLKQPFSYKDCPNTIFQITSSAPWTKIFRREFILQTGLQFQHIRNTNDLFFVYSALAMAKSIITLDKTLVYYRVGMKTNLQATKSKSPRCFYEAYSALHDKLVEVNVLDTVRKSYVNHALMGCLFNLQTTQQDPIAAEAVRNIIKYEALDKLGLTGFNETYFYNKQHYEELMALIQERENEYE